jgi:hypothetical protein
MNVFAVVVDPTIPDDAIVEILRGKLGGGECHAMNNVWCVRSDRSADDIYNMLVTNGLLANAAFMVIPIDGVWRANPPCHSAIECWDFNQRLAPHYRLPPGPTSGAAL